MNQDFFVRRKHINIKTHGLMLFGFFCFIIMYRMITDKKIYFGWLIFLAILLLIILCLIKSLESYGIYINNGEVYYKNFMRKKIDINSVVGIKIIKAREEVGAWPAYDLKDVDGNNLYSMIFLSEIENDMKEYSKGDIEFLSVYREDIIMYCVYDERLIDFFKERIPSLEIL